VHFISTEISVRVLPSLSSCTMRCCSSSVKFALRSLIGPVIFVVLRLKDFNRSRDFLNLCLQPIARDFEYLMFRLHQIVKLSQPISPHDESCVFVLLTSAIGIASHALRMDVRRPPPGRPVLTFNEVAGVALFPKHQPMAGNAPHRSAFISVAATGIDGKKSV
jgi:hypothetical protein